MLVEVDFNTNLVNLLILISCTTSSLFVYIWIIIQVSLVVKLFCTFLYCHYPSECLLMQLNLILIRKINIVNSTFFLTESLFWINVIMITNSFEFIKKVLSVKTRNSFFITETLFRINIIIYSNEKFWISSKSVNGANEKLYLFLFLSFTYEARRMISNPVQSKNNMNWLNVKQT